ncbi:MAG: hypothetical protein GY827_06930 [Cytophagales bacterium]|nr:hypothetical protein [Cytophagales bacterium]
MESNAHKIRELIREYEDDKISINDAVENINKLTGTTIKKELLKTYWNSMSLEEFVSLISAPELENWKELTDSESIDLINEIMENLSNTGIITRNMNALEKRYSKPQGTISDWIFHDDITDPKELLQYLKTDTIIRL